MCFQNLHCYQFHCLFWSSFFLHLLHHYEKLKTNWMNFTDSCEHLEEISKTVVCLCLTITALFSSLCSWTDCDFNLCYFCRRSYGLCKTFAFFTRHDTPQPDALELWLPTHLLCLLLLSLQFIYPRIQSLWPCIHFVSIYLSPLTVCKHCHF